MTTYRPPAHAGPTYSARRHVPEVALEWMLQHPEERWRRFPGTLCFADVSGFTALAERLVEKGRMGGEELVETLGGIFSQMLDIAAVRGGSLLKFGGDALLLLFRGDDHTLQAASAAVEMRQTLQRAYGTPTSVGPLRLRMSVGLHSGDVDLFLVGGRQRQLVVLGPAADGVVTAEQIAEAGEIVVSASTVALLPGNATTASRGGGRALRWRKSRSQPRGAAAPDSCPESVIAGLLPEALVTHLGPGAPDPEHRIACIAFARFSGTDAMLVEQGPEGVAAALDATLAGVQQILTEEGVTLLEVDVDRDGGKLFMAAGVPFGHEDDEGVMLRAARRMLDLELPLPLQIGVNRGHVFAAEVGNARRAAYSAMGDTTNTAARIAAKTPPGSLFAHPTVLDESLTRFTVSAAGPLTMKGKSTPQSVYRVGDVIGVRSREGLDVAELFGRDDELQLLLQLRERALAGAGSAVTLSGEPGVGKTRLLDATLADLAPLRQLRVRGEPYGAASTYRMFRDAIRELLGIERGPAVAMEHVLRDGLSQLDPGLLPWAPLLGDVCHIELAPTPEVAAIEPKFLPQRTAEVVIEVIARARPGPLVIAVDDGHWSDAASRGLLRHIGRACAERPWWLIATQRPGGAEPIFESARDIPLAPLSDPDIRRFIELAMVAAPPRPEALQELVRRSGGIPLFASELVRAFRDIGSIDALPVSLEAAMSAQVDALDPTARRVLRYASVLGRSCSRAQLASLLEADGHELNDVILSRIEGFLIADGEQRLRFRNGLMRDTVYEALSYRLRSRLHRVAAEAIEREAGDPDVVADSLAMHFSRGQNHAKAWRYARIAGRRSAETFANMEALKHFRLAVESARKSDDVPAAELAAVWTALGEVCHALDDVPGALEAYRQARRYVGDDAIAQARLLYRSSRARELGGAFSQALRDLSRGARLARESDSPPARAVLAELEAQRAMIHFGQDRLDDALAAAEAAVPLARATGRNAALVRALNVLEIAGFLRTGRIDGRHLQEALEVATRLDQKSSLALAYTNLGNLKVFAGQWAEALEYLGRGRELQRQAGDYREAAIASANLAEILLNQRRATEARQLLEEAERHARGLDDREILASILLQLARVHIHERDPDAAVEEAMEARREFEKLGQPRLVFETDLVMAEARLFAGATTTALEELEAAIAAAGASAAYLACKSAYLRARLLSALGRHEEALAEVDAGIATARDQALRYELAQLIDIKSTVLGALGRPPRAEETAEARGIFEELGVQA